MIKYSSGFVYLNGFVFSFNHLFSLLGMSISQIKSVASWRLLILAALLFGGAQGNVFGQIFNEEFGGDFDCTSQGTQADGFIGVEGEWTVTEVNGAAENGVLSNRWYVSNSVLGDAFIGSCTQPCAGLFLNSFTLHIGNSQGTPDEGAVYQELGTGLFATNKRVESPTIDCSGLIDLEVSFAFAHAPNAEDQCFLSYWDGTTWTDLQPLANTGTAGCVGNNMVWSNATINLPASANNNSDVRIGFRWVNNDTEVAGIRPSVVIDNVVVNAGEGDLPEPAFVVIDDEYEICEENCIVFLDQTTFDDNSLSEFHSYEWEFEGGDPATSENQNPSVCYSEPGEYNVTLTVTDNFGTSIPLIAEDTITVLDCGPDLVVSVNNATPCLNEQCINLSSEGTTGNNIDPNSWVWTLTSEDGSDVVVINGEPNPSNVCLSTLGFYDLTVSATDDDLTETATFENYIEVLDCSGPDISFTASQTVICPGDCIQFTDESTTNSTITEWNWTFPGGTPEESSEQNPEVCYNAAGSYWATLSAVDAEGPSARPDSILITVDPCTGPPEPAFTVSNDTICIGDCVDFQNQSIGSQSTYLWIFGGIGETSTEEDPQTICYNQSSYAGGPYPVTLIVASEIATVQPEPFTITVVDTCINPPVPRIEVSQDTVCAGQCIDFTSVSTGIGQEQFTYEWSFQGAAEGSETSTDQNPTSICYDQQGVYDVALTVSRPNGEDSTRVLQYVVTVVTTPECRPEIIPNIPDTICAGDCALFGAEFINADSVRWTFPGGTPEVSNAFSPGLVCFNQVGDYTIIVEAFNPAGPAVPVFQNIFVGARPPLNAGPDLNINAGAVVELTASLGGQAPNGTFLWQPFDLVDNFRAQTVSTSPEETTTFIVFYDQDSACTAIDSVTVNVNFIPAVGVPNSFSPNGDGVNDELRVLGQGISRMQFQIFNRYGQLVFETENQAEGWDGTMNDKELNSGTFVYTLEVTFSEGIRETYTGNITLVR